MRRGNLLGKKFVGCDPYKSLLSCLNSILTPLLTLDYEKIFNLTLFFNFVIFSLLINFNFLLEMD